MIPVRFELRTESNKTKHSYGRRHLPAELYSGTEPEITWLGSKLLNYTVTTVFI